MAEHKRVPIRLLKLCMIDSFAVWCKERNARQTPENMIEFLLQMGFIQGKRFREYIDDITVLPCWQDIQCYSEPLIEGFYTPDTWI